MRLDHRHGKQGKQKHETHVVQFEKFVGKEQKQGPLNGESFWFGQPMKGECRTSWTIRETGGQSGVSHVYAVGTPLKERRELAWDCIEDGTW
jgi:hypothetical protein